MAACLYHLQNPVPKRRASPVSSSPARPSTGKTGSLGWQRRFLRCSPVRKAPKDTGSRRRLSPPRLEDHAALLVVQAVSARRTDRPIAWLALVLYDLETHRPAGASRADARDHICGLAAALAVSADWRSGRRSRPGRQVSAALLGLAERTITRHLALLEKRGLAKRKDDGDLLNAEARADARAETEEGGTPDRWVNRAEFELLIPAWVRELTDAQIMPYIERAAALLDDLAAPARSATVDNRADRPVDNSPGQAGNTGSVTPSRFFRVLGSLPVRRGFLSLPVAVDKSPAAEPVVTPEKKQRGGASRPSPTGAPRRSSGRTAAPWALRLARQLAADGRLAFVGYHNLPGVISVLTKALKPLWQVDDVMTEIGLRLRETQKPLLSRPDRPLNYLRWLLANAVPDEPPAQIAAAAAASARELAHARAERWERQAQAGAAGRAGPGIQEARRVAAAAAERNRQATVDAARRK